MKDSIFAALHVRGKPFLLGNVWDAASARAAMDAGVKAVGTSSAAIAATFGVQDGSGMRFDTLRPVVDSILRAVDGPVSVDLEAGYADNPTQIARHIIELQGIGVAGINIEDSVVDPVRRLRPLDEFLAMLESVCDQLARENCPIFINVRTDGFVLDLPDALDETLRRARAFGNVGADGLFVPGIRDPDQILAVVNATSLPLNVMAIPGLPDVGRLAELGVARISLGNFVHDLLMRIARDCLAQAQQTGRFDHVF